MIYTFCVIRAKVEAKWARLLPIISFYFIKNEKTANLKSMQESILMSKY